MLLRRLSLLLMAAYTAAIIIAAPVHSANAPALRIVTSPYVTGGKWDLQNNGTYTWGDDTFATRLKAAYGLNNRWAVAGEVLFTQDDNDALDGRFFRLETIYSTAPRGINLIDSALRLRYDFSLQGGQPDVFGADILMGKDAGPDWQHLFNISNSIQTGDNSRGTFNLGGSWQGLYRLSDTGSIGGQVFANFGQWNQLNDSDRYDIRVGPALQYRPPGSGWTMLGAVLAGASDNAPDVSVNYTLRYSF